MKVTITGERAEGKSTVGKIVHHYLLSLGYHASIREDPDNHVIHEWHADDHRVPTEDLKPRLVQISVRRSMKEWLDSQRPTYFDVDVAWRQGFCWGGVAGMVLAILTGCICLRAFTL